MNTPAPALNDSVIEEGVARYWREHDRYVELATRVGDICRAQMAEDAIRAQVIYRAKDPDSLRGKLRKYRANSAAHDARGHLRARGRLGRRCASPPMKSMTATR